MARGGALHDQLLAAIRTAADNPSISWERTPRRLGSHHWAEVYRVRLAGDPRLEGDLVAKVMPEAEPGMREILALTHVANAGFPAPSVRLSSRPTSALDRTWMLMDFVPGHVPIADATKRALIGSLPRRVCRVPDELAAVMVALHRVDPTPIAAGLGPSGVPGSSLEWLYSEATRTTSSWLMARAEHLAATRPAFRRSVLCHGDVQPLNLVETPAGCVLLDWTNVQYDDPHFDIATTRMLLHHAPISAQGLVRRPVAALGQTLASQFATRYERLSGERIDHARLDWFTRLAALRVFVLLDRHVHGSASPDRNHPFVRLGPMLLRDLDWPAKGAPGMDAHR